MTFISRRKRQTILRALRASRAATIISALVLLSVVSSARAQVHNTEVITPNYAPSNSGVIQASQVVQPPQPKVIPQVRPGMEAGGTQRFIRTELPGPQRLFMRESESQFYDRMRQEAKEAGDPPALFPEEIPINKKLVTVQSYPRIDPLSPTGERVASLTFEVEPSYVCHRRLLFEQPNFERIGWDFGILQPGLEMGTFYYDLVLSPYHFWSNLSNRGECTVGKCLPGDPAPFTVPIERFSVTGIIGEAGFIIGGLYLLPHNP
jgi:hypothetical protein